MFKSTRMIILGLAEDYINDENWHRGRISSEWIEKITNALGLEELSFCELWNMRDMVELTLESEINFYERNYERRTARKYLDAQSAFIEVVNAEARRRKNK